MEWQPIPELSDEFNRRRLNETKWQPEHPYWDGREPSQFDPDNVSVSGGVLRLRSVPLVDDLAAVQDPEQDVWVGAACLASTKPIATYGYYEARFKASALSMTSSFWFQGKYSEIDVVEQMGAPAKHPRQRTWMRMNTHYYPGGWENDRKTPVNWQMPSGAADEYHVYGMWWRDADTVWMYHNGEKVAEIKFGGPFEEPMYLFFDTEVFVWEGLPTLESLRDPELNTMHVDWVRAWRLVEQ
jgi:hypothetical protein